MNFVGFNDARKTISRLRNDEGWKIEDCRLSNGCKLYWPKGGCNEWGYKADCRWSLRSRLPTFLLMLWMQIKNSRLDLSLNIPDPQMLVSKRRLACMHTRKLFVCHWSAWCKEKFSLFCIAYAFWMKMDVWDWIITGPANYFGLIQNKRRHVAKIGRRLHRIAGFPININSENIIIHMLREFQPPMRHKIFDACMNHIIRISLSLMEWATS